MNKNNKQLKVATIRGGKVRNINLILGSLRSHPEGMTPKQIALDTSINVNYVKSLLPSLLSVRKKMRGLYIVVEGGDGAAKSVLPSLDSWTFHNCILTCKLKDWTALYRKYTYNLINLELTISTSGKATLRLACDTPLNVSSLCMVYGWFIEILRGFCKDFITSKEVFISTIEFNHDYSNLRLDGLRCISIDALTTQFKAYQKKLSLRIEHKTKVPMTVNTILDLLTQNPNSTDLHVKVNKMVEAQERLFRATKINTQILLTIIDTIKEAKQ